ncbi:MAG: NADAR family protein [Kouleothrix sp.]
MKTISFYRVREPYGFCSNFAPYPIVIDELTWPTSEHYFQAQKFFDETIQTRIRHAASPMEAATLGRDRRFPIRPDWESIKDDIMYDAVRAKFTQHQAIRDQLLATGDAYLIEHTANDRYWADGGDGTGKNRLGQILMRVREELRAGE